MNKGFGMIGLLVAVAIVGLLAMWMMRQTVTTVQTRNQTYLQGVNQAKQIQEQLKKQQQRQQRQLERLGH